MYPTLYDAFLDLFGLSIPTLKVVMTFGFFVAMAFIAAYLVMTSELKRLEAAGKIKSLKKTIKPVSPTADMVMNIVIGFLVGYKLIALVLNIDEYGDNPQGFILSREGSLLYGLIGAVVAGVYKYYERKRKPPKTEAYTIDFHPYEMMGNMTFIAALAGFAGAKIFHHLENWSDFIADPIGALSDPFSGLTFFGGLICGGAAVLWYAKKHGVKWNLMLDVGAPAMMLAYGVGRMGCHFSGDGDWGIVNTATKPSFLNWLPDWAWAYDYPNNVLGIQLADPVFPTPLYEIFMALGIFGILWMIRSKFSAAGMLFSVYLILSGIERFVIESIRVNTKLHFAGLTFTQAEMISVVFVILGAVGLWYFKKSESKKSSAA